MFNALCVICLSPTLAKSVVSHPLSSLFLLFRAFGYTHNQLQYLMHKMQSCVWPIWSPLGIILTVVLTTQALSHCERITDSGIRHLTSGACSETLQVLELDNCPLITDYALELLRWTVTWLMQITLLFQWPLSWLLHKWREGYLLPTFRPDDDWSIHSKRRQVIFRAQVGNRWPSLHHSPHSKAPCCLTL